MKFKSSCAGFLLIEVLVGLGLSLVLLAAFAQSQRTFASSTQKLRHAEAERQAQDYVRNTARLEGARYFRTPHFAVIETSAGPVSVNISCRSKENKTGECHAVLNDKEKIFFMRW